MKFNEMMAMKAKGRGDAKAGMQEKAPMKFAKGGSIDGCATKGKTKGTIVKMKSGGRCK